MSKKFSSTVAGGAIFITVIGLLSRLLGLVRESIFASFFGLTQDYNLYLIAVVFPVTINSVFIYFTQNYYIPKYFEFKNKSDSDASEFNNSVFWFLIGLGFLITIFLYLFSTQIISAYLSIDNPIQLNTVANVFKILVLSIPFGFSSSILSAMLQANYEFKFPSFSQLFLNLSIIIIVILFSKEIGIFATAWGFLVGMILQFLYLLFKTIKITTLKIKVPSFPDMIKIFDVSLIIILFIEIVGQIYPLSDRYFLNLVDEGGIAALNYSFNIFLLPITIISMSVSTALLPRLSSLLSDGTKSELSRSMNLFFEVMLFMFVPIVFILFFDGDIIIRILFQRGKFLSNDTFITFNTLRFYSLSLVFFAIYSGINKLLYGSKMIKQLFLIVITAALSKIVLNFILVKIMKQDGLALSTSISFFILFAGGYLTLISKKIISTNLLFIKNVTINIINIILSYVSVKIFFYLLFGEELVYRILLLFAVLLVYLINSIIIKREALQVFIRTIKSVPLFNNIQKNID